jgi:predicted nucleotide-binding protein
MSRVAITFAKLAALYKELRSRATPTDKGQILDYLERYALLRAEIVAKMPELYSDLPHRIIPTDLAYLKFEDYHQLRRDIEYVFEVRANSELRSEPENIAQEVEVEDDRLTRVFISHGRSPDWREVQSYIEKDLHTDTLELAQQPNRGRTVLQKLDEESDKCCFVVVVMTGDDDVVLGAPRARENVLHEIGFFQGKLGLENVCLLHEEGTNIPSNIHGLVYIPFPKGLVSASFGVLARELKAALDKMS